MFLIGFFFYVYNTLKILTCQDVFDNFVQLNKTEAFDLGILTILFNANKKACKFLSFGV